MLGELEKIYLSLPLIVLPISFQKRHLQQPKFGYFSGRAKGAAKGSCGETVVQKGVFGESVSSLHP